ncbi:CheR family methyltransferase [Miltoncostaea oceani]|uniref:CheR family methyltransferase n=1 Tax=Miltoncostaea oceani TaxID=2843216 RepID=UPI001C3DCD8D|nr:protein-glutamate O-methyltransferase CheR [Miltoncostaea oceani]
MSTSTDARTPEGPAAADYARFCGGVRSLLRIDLDDYRRGQMERRLRSFARRSGDGDLDAYLERLRRDVAAREAFLDHMTINVSELFRNPERFAELERDILPGLVATAGRRGLKVWSAGCSYGAEPYSLGVLLAEADPGARHEITATDLDERVLARAREGRFTEADMRAVTRARRERWFRTEADGGVRADDALRRSIRFSRLDLLADRFPAGQDLILCRNVVIYFTEDAKERLYSRFLQALRPGGVLFVGATERIARSDELGWEKQGMFFYRRPDGPAVTQEGPNR